MHLATLYSSLKCSQIADIWIGFHVIITYVHSVKVVEVNFSLGFYVATIQRQISFQTGVFEIPSFFKS